MKESELLSHLLNKYERSKHLSQPGASSRRVMLRIENDEFPEYDYEDAQVRDKWNEAVKALEARGLIKAEWVHGRPVLSCVTLNLEHLSECYQITGRTHPRELSSMVAQKIESSLSQATTDWIVGWKENVCHQAKVLFRVPAYCKKDLSLLDKLLTAFTVYDSLHGESITMRAFSSRCYHNTKTFEREVRDQFLRIALEYSQKLKEACEQSEMGDREQLAYLGIYARPELYELSGNCIIQTENGNIGVNVVTPYGLALPSPCVDLIQAFDLRGIQKIVFIENKTNYDEYVTTELHPEELAVYHGGFLSPQKRKFFEKMAASIKKQTTIFFWADIDLGGFQMFERLQAIFPSLLPMRMSAEDVVSLHSTGLKRPERYLGEIQAAIDGGKYPLFHEAMKKIVEYGVTIEQEAFLTE